LDLDWVLGEISLLKEWSGIGTAVQGSGGVTIPGGVQKTRRYGASGRGLAGMVVLGWRLDSMILEVFSKLNDSLILICVCDSAAEKGALNSRVHLTPCTPHSGC